MAQNSYNTASIPSLVTLVNQILAAMSPSPTTYGATATQMTSLTTALDNLTTAASNKDSAYAAALAATQGQDTAKQAVIDQVQVLASQMYAKTTLTNEQIQATGLAVHDDVKSHVTPQQPTGLEAFAYADSTVFLKWNRNGNPYGIQFVVEAQVDGGAWTQVYSTKKKSARFGGFTPGVLTFFRVTAWNNDEASFPSLTASIYGGESQVSLQLAA